ncbi:MAG: tyrosine--tRNA ligase, partial [Deltaproteobacteria bacterium]|nr:tyrosine--tRNA ligase [Deltaproteobacteria bacterium]
IDLLREVGACFSVNNMLRAECYKQRMERGLSFFEFNYMIMQSYDFLHLHRKYGCNMQFGGDDQWSNMLAGTDLIRKKTGDDSYAMTITLLMNSEGKKMGKTANGAVWLDPQKTTPFEFYQYWRNIDDSDVMKCFRLLTFLSLDEIAELETWDDSRINERKALLAHELTALVHGQEEADKAQKTAVNLFSRKVEDSDMPSTILEASSLSPEGISLAELMLTCGLVKSKAEARRLVEQGGVSVDEEKAESGTQMISRDTLKKGVVIRKGKKIFHKAFEK